MAGDSKLRPLFTWRSAISEAELSSTSKHVALALSLYMSERGDSAYPGIERLARETGRSRRTIIRALNDLREQGWLEVLEPGGGRGHATVYQASLNGVTTSPFTERETVPSETERVPPATIKGVTHGTPSLRNSHKHLPTREMDKPDYLLDRAAKHFWKHRIPRDATKEAVAELREADIGDTVIDEAIGQCIAANARSLSYLTKTAHDWFQQRVG
jgi:biotin operon repressor